MIVRVGYSTCQERRAVRFVYLYLFQHHYKNKYSMEGPVFKAITGFKGQLFPQAVATCFNN